MLLVGNGWSGGTSGRAIVDMAQRYNVGYLPSARASGIAFMTA